MYFHYIVIIFPLYKFEPPSPKNALCQVWFKLAQWFWGRFLNLVNVFSLFVITSPWKWVGPFIWIYLSPLYPRILCAKFSWNWLPVSGSGEEDEMCKVYDNIEDDKDEGQIWIRKTHYRWAKICSNHTIFFLKKSFKIKYASNVTNITSKNIVLYRIISKKSQCSDNTDNEILIRGPWAILLTWEDKKSYLI